MAKKRKKQLTPNQQEYNREIKNLKSRIKQAEKKGYKFSNFQFPERPERITKKDIQSIKNIRGEELYKQADEKEDYIPDYNFLQSLTDKIDELIPGIGYQYSKGNIKYAVNFIPAKTNLISYLDHRATIEPEYIEYLKSKESEIISMCYTVREAAASNAQTALDAINKVFAILKAAPITITEAQEIEELNEFYESGYNDE